jgi:hypothetical protein
MADNHRQMLKVMISSTAYDLPDHRQQVMDACIQQEMYPIAMEHLPASDADAIRTSLDMVNQADVYLGVIGFRYGHVPTGHTISITEMEYNRAVERDMKCLIFLMHKNHPLKETDVEKGEGADKLEAFKNRLTNAHVVKHFTSPDDLRAHVVNSLSQLHRTPLQQATISYPWLETGYVLTEPNKKAEGIQLYIAVRDEPADPDAVTVSSLQNLKLELSMPVAVGENGWHSCGLARVDLPEVNNYDVTSSRHFLVELKNDITVLEIRGASRNAGWTEGTVVIHRKVGYVDWEKSLGGWVKTPQGLKSLLVGETRQNGVTTRTKRKPINLTRDLLIQYGIPVKGN